MRNIFLVLKHEILVTIQKPSFWVMTFLLPGLIIALNIGTQLMAQDSFENAPSFLPGSGEAGAPQETAAAPPVIGLVDEAQVITALPPNLPAQLVQSFATETAARQALEAGEIDQYYRIPADFRTTGQVEMVSEELQPLENPSTDLLNYILAYGMTGDTETAVALIEPSDSVFSHDLAPQDTQVAGAENGDGPLAFFVPFAVLFIFFFLITMSSGFMLQSVSREKENRTVEILLLSLHPRDLMVGKVLGLSLVALLQLAFWFGGGLLALDRARGMFSRLGDITLPQGFVLWGLGFFLLGYLLYASIMGAMGALAPNAREGGQFTFFVLLPLMIPLWLNYAFIEAPNGTLATVLSLIPLTAPVAMMTRIAATSVPVWQILLSLAGLALTTYLLVLLSARFFRADTLLSDATLQWRRVVAQLRG